MYCIHCGKTIPEGTRFCIYCGKQQIVEESVAAEAHDNEQKTHLNAQDDRQKTSPPEQAADAESSAFDNAADQQENASVKEIARELKNVGNIVLNATEETRNDTHCPFCGANNCQPIHKTTAETSSKNYSWSSGCCGMLLLGPFGLLCGLCGASSKSKISSELWWTCMKCGKQHLAMSDGLKKWDQFVSRLPVNVCTVGILFLIVRYLDLGIIGLLLKLIFIVAPPVALYALHEEISEELGIPLIDYLSPERKKKCLWTLLGSTGVVLAIGFFGLSVLERILGE